MTLVGWRQATGLCIPAFAFFVRAIRSTLGAVVVAACTQGPTEMILNDLGGQEKRKREGFASSMGVIVDPRLAQQLGRPLL